MVAVCFYLFILFWYSLSGSLCSPQTLLLVAALKKVPLVPVRKCAPSGSFWASFITSTTSPVVYALLFMDITAFIVYNGVQEGIERVSKWMMPVLLVLVVIIAIFSLSLKHTDASGQIHTELQGFLYYLTPNLEGLTVQRFLQILLDAMIIPAVYVFFGTEGMSAGPSLMFILFLQSTGILS